MVTINLTKEIKGKKKLQKCHFCVDGNLEKKKTIAYQTLFLKQNTTIENRDCASILEANYYLGVYNVHC